MQSLNDDEENSNAKNADEALIDPKSSDLVHVAQPLNSTKNIDKYSIPLNKYEKEERPKNDEFDDVLAPLSNNPAAETSKSVFVWQWKWIYITEFALSMNVLVFLA